MRNLTLLLLAVGLNGCVIYEQGLDDTAGGGSDGRPGQPGDTTGSNDTNVSDSATPAPVVNLWLDPAGAIPGDTAILSLYSDGDVDLTTVQDVRFFGEGNVDVVATDTRGKNEFLLTISVPDTAALGGNGMLVEFSDGTALFVDSAFQVVADPAQIPPPAFEAPAGSGCN